MEVNTHEIDTGVVITLMGKMMLGYEANDFNEAIRNAVDKGKKKIVVNLSDVHFISSWGIGILVHGYTTTTREGGEFKLVGVSEKINETFRKVKLDNIFEKFVTVEEALKD